MSKKAIYVSGEVWEALNRLRQAIPKRGRVTYSDVIMALLQQHGYVGGSGVAQSVEEALKSLRRAFGVAYASELASSADTLLDVISVRDDMQKLRTAIWNRFTRRVYAQCPQGHKTLLYVERASSFRLRKSERKYEEVAKAALEGRQVSVPCPVCGAESGVVVKAPSRLMSEGIVAMLKTGEEIINATLMETVRSHPIYTAWGQFVRGLGVANSARLVALYEKVEDKVHVAKAWMYVGLAPVSVCSNKCGWWGKEPARVCPRCGAPAVQVAPTRLNATKYNVEKFPVSYRLMRHMYILARYFIVYGGGSKYGKLARAKIDELTKRFRERGIDQKLARAKAANATWRWLARVLVEHAFAVANIVRGIYQGPPKPILAHGAYIPPLVDDVEEALKQPPVLQVVEWYRKHLGIDIVQYWHSI
ncbi:hypothetical protein [Pyrobaculum sp.]|uniref:hypothetical protein n=1 Tax=Pyrobaculum sp. TaxID=2004705 RepID=UPI003D13C68D